MSTVHVRALGESHHHAGLGFAVHIGFNRIGADHIAVVEQHAEFDLDAPDRFIVQIQHAHFERIDQLLTGRGGLAVAADFDQIRRFGFLAGLGEAHRGIAQRRAGGLIKRPRLDKIDPLRRTEQITGLRQAGRIGIDLRSIQHLTAALRRDERHREIANGVAVFVAHIHAQRRSQGRGDIGLLCIAVIGAGHYDLKGSQCLERHAHAVRQSDLTVQITRLEPGDAR